MALADFAMYAALLGALGEVPLAVTTSLNINFLQRPRPGGLVATCRLLKLCKRLAVGAISIYSQGRATPVAPATAPYSIPPSGCGDGRKNPHPPVHPPTAPAQPQHS